jgi:hypothetical protein
MVNSSFFDPPISNENAWYIAPTNKRDTQAHSQTCQKEENAQKVCHTQQRLDRASFNYNPRKTENWHEFHQNTQIEHNTNQKLI